MIIFNLYQNFNKHYSIINIKKMTSNQQRVSIITGAGMGLGLAASKELAAQNHHLSLVDYNEQALNDAKKDSLSDMHNTQIITVVADDYNEEAVKNHVDRTMEAFGRLDARYNIAVIEGKQAGT